MCSLVYVPAQIGDESAQSDGGPGGAQGSVRTQRDAEEAQR